MRAAVVLALVAGCKVDDPGEPPLRRLSPTEYNNSIRDLLGYAPGGGWPASEEDEERIWPWTFPADVPVHGFEGMAEGQVASGYLIEQYQAAAAHFAPLVLGSPAFWACEDRDCSEESTMRFAHRAFRRPLDDGEARRLRAFHAANRQAYGDEDGTVLTVQGVLQAPQFLYRLEPRPADAGGERVALGPFELASRLSYFLWDSMPDPALFEAAATGNLSSKAQIERQVRRMLEDPRARGAVVHFHRQWLGIDDVFANRASAEAYASVYLPRMLEEAGGEGLQEVEELWSSSLIGMQAAMVREADLFVERTVFDSPGRLSDLLTDHHGYATKIRGILPTDTFRLYGVTDADVLPSRYFDVDLDDDNIGYALSTRPVTLPEDQRAGILGLGAVLAARAHPVHPAPVLRGVFVLEQLLCEAIGQPPDDAVLQAPPDSLSADATNRERLEAVTSSAPCAGCHARINPLGYAFEHYDSLGGWRDADQGRAIDASGTLDLGEGPVSFDGAVELAAHLAASPRVHDCYATHWTRYALGTDVGPGDPTLERVQQRFRGRHEGKVTELLVDLATSAAFRFRRNP